MALHLLNIVRQKVTYLVEVMNEKGETKQEWLDEETIKFINPDFTFPVAVPVQNDTSVQDDLKCTLCSRQFKRRDHLKDHVKRHLEKNQDQYNCPVCPSKFGYRSNWTQHMKRSHKWAPKKCKDEIEKAKVVNLESDEDEIHVEHSQAHNTDFEEDAPIPARGKRSRKRKSTSSGNSNIEGTEESVQTVDYKRVGRKRQANCNKNAIQPAQKMQCTERVSSHYIDIIYANQGS